MRSMGGRRTAVRGAAVGLAAIGILSSHWLAYFLAEPSGHLRAHILQASGHRHYSSVAAVLVVLGLVMLAISAVSGVGLRGHRMAPRSWLRSVVLIQLAGFVLLEGIERVFVSHSGGLIDLIHEPAFLVGVAIQLAVAVANMALLRSVLFLVRTLRRARASSGERAPAVRQRLVSLFVTPPPAPCSGAASLRAPPRG